MLMAIKFAKYYELTRKDIVLTVFTDSMQLYQSRLREARKKNGEYEEKDAIRDFHRRLMGLKTDAMIELSHNERKRIHNLKYFTWIEQQMLQIDELNRQWYDYESYWSETQKLTPKIDELIDQFNEKVALM
jgi:beta-phosphoglucomutase-like phosphatase (HAD superfamily)